MKLNDTNQTEVAVESSCKAAKETSDVTVERVLAVYKDLYISEGVALAEEYLQDTFEEIPEEVAKEIEAFILSQNS